VSSLNVISLTATLLESSLMRPGTDALGSAADINYLLVRAEDGVYTAAWEEGEADEVLQAALEELDALLEEVAAEPTEEAGTVTAEPEGETTATPAATPTPTQAPTPTPGS
jgi:hypothetical protein